LSRLPAVKADERALERGTVQAHTGHALKRVLPLVFEIAVIDEVRP
jgi:hypothetical protein